MATKHQREETPEPPKLMCGIVMPISEIDGCTETHWLEVKEIISASIIQADFEPNLVSNADDVGVIQKRIIQNLYDNPIVVVDVSGKNSNVMFELGMRLAFDKPTIILKDDRTQYSFDTSPVEHLEYPRDLRFSKIVDFKERLTEKIKNTHKKASSDANFSTFLKHFGSFKVAKIETEVVSKEDYILEEIKNLREIVLRDQRSFNREPLVIATRKQNQRDNEVTISFTIPDRTHSDIMDIKAQIQNRRGILFTRIKEFDKFWQFELTVDVKYLESILGFISEIGASEIEITSSR